MLSKRIFDIICSFIGLIILSPVLIIIAILIKLSSSGGVFFKQRRVGLNSRLFFVYKFRTMVPDAEIRGLKITIDKDPRITKLGELLRKTKLDELPQLFNVLIGNMSLVGPRPEVPEYVNLYPEDIKRIVLSVKPGITDWASIKMIDESDILGKSQNPKDTYIKVIMPEKLNFAVNYVRNRSLCGDIVIIFATLFKIIKR